MPQREPARSLLSLGLGETAEIREILFDSVREHCARAGLAVGDTLTGRGGDGRDVALQTSRGRIAVLDRTVARFVQIDEPRGNGIADVYERRHSA